MQVLQQGKYVGKVLSEIDKEGLFANVSTYDRDNFNNDWHYHINPHISFVLFGGCAERKKSSYERLPGRITFYSACEPHLIMAMKNSIHVNLELDRPFLSQYGLPENILGLVSDKTPDAGFFMLRIYRELMTGDSFTESSVHMLMLKLIGDSKRLMDDNKIPAWLKTTREYLHENWDQTVSLQDLSDATRVHPVTISRYFPRYFSSTIGSYMRKLKVERALHLIKTSDASLTQIAYECGFYDQSHFIRTFRNLTGFNPIQYKRL
jgi:AraC family transcriptional regulator